MTDRNELPSGALLAFRRPHVGQVWSFAGGPRHDIIKRISRGICTNRGTKTAAMYVHWESGLMTITLRELKAQWQYRGFFHKANSAICVKTDSKGVQSGINAQQAG